jgi:hypothetical protein
MPPKKLLSQLGNIEEFAATYTADIQHRDDQGKNQHIRGPGRSSRTRAERDLASMREASQGHATWAEGLAALRSKNLELHQASEKEARVAMGIDQYLSQRMAHKVEDSDPETDGDDDDGTGDPYHGIDLAACVKLAEEPPAKIEQREPPKDANDASVQLACFRSIKETPEALEAILLARADPNLVVDDDISPLRKVIAFARTRDVAAMRELLLRHGAMESKFERQRWHERQSADANESAWLRNFHRSAFLRLYKYAHTSGAATNTVSLIRDDREG